MKWRLFENRLILSTKHFMPPHIIECGIFTAEFGYMEIVNIDLLMCRNPAREQIFILICSRQKIRIIYII